MRIKNKKTYYLKRKVMVEDEEEGGKYPGYSEPIEIKANISPASGKLQSEIYGQRLNYILNMLYDEDVQMVEDDGICVYVPKESDPDYKIISIKRYSHLFIELEKI